MPILEPQLNPADESYPQQMLTEALKNLQAAMAANQYSTGGRQVTHQTLSQLRNEVTLWQRIVTRREAKAQGAKDPQTQIAIFGRKY